MAYEIGQLNNFQPNNMFGIDNTNVGNNFNNQTAFNPGAMLDREIKALDVMPDINPTRYDQLRQMDIQQNHLIYRLHFLL